MKSASYLTLTIVLAILTGCSSGGSESSMTDSGDASNSSQTESLVLDIDRFNTEINKRIIQSSCVSCHSAGSLAGNTRLVFEFGNSLNVAANNADILNQFPYANIFLDKVSNKTIHAGANSVIFTEDSDEYAKLSNFLSTEDYYTSVETVAPTPPVNLPPEMISSLITSWNFDNINGNLIDDEQGVVTNSILSGDVSIVDGVADFGGDANQSGSISVPVENIANKLNTELTISMWVKGHDNIPNNTTILYATDSNGKRILNIHLPFGKTIYWDAGDASDYDRVSNTVSVNDTKNRWAHWAFTKNANSGEMKIYLDGQQFASANNKTRVFPAISQLTIGAKNTAGNLGYRGQIDALRIYKKALTSDEISAEYALGNSTAMPAPEEPSPVIPNNPATPVIPAEPASPAPPVDMTNHDTDGDGVFNIADLYPDDASRISEPGFYYEKWNIKTNSVDELLDYGLLQEAPQVSTVVTDDLIAATNQGNNYSHRMRAYITPTQTANYHLYVASDDGASVWLSRNSNPTLKTRIITFEEWAGNKQYTKYAEQKSDLIRLEANKSYYVEIIGYEGGGADNMSLGWSQVVDGSESTITLIPQSAIQYFYLPAGMNEIDVFGDLDKDGIPNFIDTDDDNDTVTDSEDAFPLDPTETLDSDKDGLGNNADNDDDNDGVIDTIDTAPFDPSISGVNDDVPEINRTVIQSKCISCHSTSGAAKDTDLTFRFGNRFGEIEHNKTQLSFYITEQENGSTTLLDKSRGLLGHGGGGVLTLGSVEYNLLETFVNQYSGNSTPAPDDGTYVLETHARTYRRASVYLTGEVPDRSKLQSLENSTDETLRNEILALMQGPGFHDFLKNEANARLHSRHLKTSGNGAEYFNKYYTGDKNTLRNELAEEPLELIAYIVENDRPYSEVITADYTMVSEHTAQAYKTGLTLSAGEWRAAKNKGHERKSEETFNTDATGNDLVGNYPHAGVLSSWAYLSRYPTTATNRNRARAAWTMRHFLGFDIEKSAARVLDLKDVSDQLNPTMNNPACMACHTTLDPVAGAFKNFHERVGYKAYGTDSLDSTYRENNPGVDWYHDMLPAGFRGEVPDVSEDSLQWLAKNMSADYRFAVGTVKFWWPAVFGQDVLGEEALRNQFDAQSLLINNLATKFREHLNLKQLLADMMMSDAFRVEKKADALISDDMVSLHSGARHLLTADELVKKTKSLTRFVWNENSPNLTNSFYKLYGGTDDIDVDDRPGDITSIMFRVAERQAMELSCAIVLHDFDFTQTSRKLFSVVERDTVAENMIREQIVILHERLLGQTLAANSTKVTETYNLFLELQQLHIQQGGTRINVSGTRCDNRKSGSDNDQHHVLSPWQGILMMLMTDPDYLYE